MAWGLNNTTISSNVQAFNSNSGGALASGIRNWILDSMKPYYDFYISDEECPITNAASGTHYFPFSGHHFTEQIVAKANIGALLLTNDPSSAVEYCYNKNKRTSNGIAGAIDWYLPAIDEIEDVVVGGYADFAVFQDKLYWSSQPAYTYEKWRYNAIFIGNDEGNLYEENPTHARATSVKFLGGDPTDISNYKAVDSGDYVALVINVQHSIFGSSEEPIDGAEASRGAGYLPRSSINRIRCVRNSGTITPSQTN